MNKLLSTAMTYVRSLSETLRQPEVRTQLQAVLRSEEMKTLLSTIRSGVTGGASSGAVGGSAQSDSTPTSGSGYSSTPGL